MTKQVDRNVRPSSNFKTEPVPHAVSPGAVGQLGTALGNHATGVGPPLRGAGLPMFIGRGLKAPTANTTIHPTGGQGRHK